MEKRVVDIKKLDSTQKVNYIKNLLFNNTLTESLDTLLKNEKKDLGTIKIIISSLDDDLIINRIKEECNFKDNKTTKIFIYSKIISVLFFQNKTVILNNFFKYLDNDSLKDVAIYEYQNKTSVSISCRTFEKYCAKYKKEALDNLLIDEEKINSFNDQREKYNAITNKKRKNFAIPVLIIVLVVLIMACFGYKLYSYKKLVNKYNGKFYPGLYLNKISLGGLDTKDINSIISEEKNRIENGSVIVKNINEDNSFTYKDLGISVNEKGLSDEIITYNKNLSFFKKIKLIKTNSKSKIFNLKGEFSYDKVDNFINTLKEKLNTHPKDDSIIIDNDHNVYYDKGKSGFTLDEEKAKKQITKIFLNPKDNTNIDIKGTIIKNEVKYEYLSSINKKVSSYTTHFLNAGNRGHNINLATRRLNGTIVKKGETFSYFKEVGPYGSSNGYLPAPVYLNSEVKTENGGGVCQLASTLYNASLRAGLQTVSRRGHTFAPNYVPKGLDATVYGTTTDFKFKNNYDYPIYIVSYVKGNYLTVDIWTNENALEGKTYEPYSIASNGGYLAYLKTIKDGKVIETKYLDRSVYKIHP